VGYFVFVALGFKTLESLLVATALTATSIAISIQVLTELGKMQSKEARLILGAAIADHILAIAALSVVTTMVQTGNTSPDIVDVTFLVLKILGLFAALSIGSVLLIPRMLHVEKLWKSEGSIEGITTASFFGVAAVAAFMAYLLLLDLFAVGMAVASTKLIKRVEEYVEKLQIIFAPLFFAMIGAQVDLGVTLTSFFFHVSYFYLFSQN
jgi:Kef-type K+ transport system membrane component KefB